MVAATAAVCALQGCALNTLNKGLPLLMGESLETAVQVFGLPNQKYEYGSETVWVWNNSFGGVIPIYSPSTSTTTGYVGTTPISATTTTGSTSYMPVQYQCEIKLKTDASGTINHWQYYGNEGGCSTYAGPLKRAMPKY